jgi:hypothetical protein
MGASVVRVATLQLGRQDILDYQGWYDGIEIDSSYESSVSEGVVYPISSQMSAAEFGRVAAEVRARSPYMPTAYPPLAPTAMLMIRDDIVWTTDGITVFLRVRRAETYHELIGMTLELTDAFQEYYSPGHTALIADEVLDIMSDVLFRVGLLSSHPGQRQLDLQDRSDVAHNGFLMTILKSTIRELQVCTVWLESVNWQWNEEDAGASLELCKVLLETGSNRALELF